MSHTTYVFCKKRVDNETLDDGKGGNVDIYTHMDYVLNCMGTPDCIDLLDSDDPNYDDWLKAFSDEDEYFLYSY